MHKGRVHVDVLLCRPVGRSAEVTAARRNHILELDGKPALDVVSVVSWTCLQSCDCLPDPWCGFQSCFGAEQQDSQVSKDCLGCSSLSLDGGFLFERGHTLPDEFLQALISFS